MEPHLGIRAKDWLKDRIVDFLTRPVAHYERRGRNDLAALKRHARKGDVLLVEGDQRISQVIKVLTQSTWSHSALYIGDELVRRGGALREQALAAFGSEAEHLVIEALMDGVVAEPIGKYVDFNLRLCRPVRLRQHHLRSILDDAIDAIGWEYDLRNIYDLARYFVSVALFSTRYQRRAMHFGSSVQTQVICSSLLGHLFAKVRYPVAPIVTYPDTPSQPRGGVVRRVLWRQKLEPMAVFRARHPTLLTPRDFDLSPYFEVVKFNTLAEGRFDYTRLHWDETPHPSELGAGESAGSPIEAVAATPSDETAPSEDTEKEAS